MSSFPIKTSYLTPKKIHTHSTFNVGLFGSVLMGDGMHLSLVVDARYTFIDGKIKFSPLHFINNAVSTFAYNVQYSVHYRANF